MVGVFMGSRVCGSVGRIRGPTYRSNLLYHHLICSSGSSVIESPVFVCGSAALHVRGAASPAQLLPAGLAALHLVRPAPDLVLFGGGGSGGDVPRAVLGELAAREMAFEVMDVRNAVGMYNVLAGEGRRVAAFLWCGGEEEGVAGGGDKIGEGG